MLEPLQRALHHLALRLQFKRRLRARLRPPLLRLGQRRRAPRLGRPSVRLAWGRVPALRLRSPPQGPLLIMAPAALELLQLRSSSYFNLLLCLIKHHRKNLIDNRGPF